MDLRCWTADIGVTTGFLGIAGGRLGDDVRPGAYRRSMEELADRAGEAILVYWGNLQTERSETSMLREIEVELPV